MKIFEEVFNQKILPDDGLPRAVWDTCRFRIETSWKRNCNKEASIKISRGQSIQTRKSNCCCFPVSTRGTFVKVCTNAIQPMLKKKKRKAKRGNFYLLDVGR